MEVETETKLERAFCHEKATCIVHVGKCSMGELRIVETKGSRANAGSRTAKGE